MGVGETGREGEIKVIRRKVLTAENQLLFVYTKNDLSARYCEVHFIHNEKKRPFLI